MHKSQIQYQIYNVLSLLVLTSHADIQYNIEYEYIQPIKSLWSFTDRRITVHVHAQVSWSLSLPLNGKSYELLYCNNNLSLLTARYRHQQATVGWLTQLFHMRRLLTRVSELSVEVEWSRHETNTILQKEHRSEGTVNMFRPFVSMSIISRKITLLPVDKFISNGNMSLDK